MPRELTKFRIATIGSVDRPACAPALVALVKRRADADSPSTVPEGDHSNGIMQKREEEGTVLFFIPEDVKKGIPAELVTQFEELAKKIPTSVKPQWEEFHKSLSQLDELKKQAEQVADLQKKANEADTLRTQLEELKKGSNETNPEDILKKLDGDTKALVEGLMKKAEASDKLAQEAITKANQERDERITKEYIAKASTFKALPLEPAKFGLVLKAFGEYNKELYTQLDAVLKAADELVSKGKIMGEFGTSHEGETGVWTEIEKRAEGLVKNGVCVTKEQAISKVMTDDPALYKQYREEA